MSANLFDLSGTTALVTGGNGGIGYGIAKGLADCWSNIIIAARNSEKTEQAVEELQKSTTNIKIHGLTVYVASEDSVNEMAKKALELTPRINILVNNAGINIKKIPMELSIE